MMRASGEERIRGRSYFATGKEKVRGGSYFVTGRRREKKGDIELYTWGRREKFASSRM